MKTINLVVLLLVITSSLWAQTDIVSIAPHQPKRSESVTITYNPKAPGATLTAANEFELITFAPFGPEKKTKMELKDGKWVGVVTLNDTTQTFVLFYFKSGKAEDKNSEKFWDFMIYGPDGKPLKNAHMMRAVSYKYYLARKIENRSEKALQALKEELKLYPENFAAKLTSWRIELDEAEDPEPLKKEIKKELDQLVAQHGQKKEWIPMLANGYQLIGEKQKAEELQAKAIALDPTSRQAEMMRVQKLMQTKDPEERKGLAEQFIKDFPKSQMASMAHSVLFDYFSKKGDTEKMHEAGEAWLKGSRENLNACNSVAYGYALKGIYLDDALRYANKAVAAADTFDIKNRPPQMSEEDALKMVKGLRGAFYDTRGWVYFKKGMYKEAEADLKKADELKPNDAELLNHLAETYEKQNKHKEAMSTYMAVLQTNPKDSVARGGLKRSYVKKNGSEAGFDDMLTALQSKVKESAVGEASKLPDRVNKPAPAINAKDLAGKPVTLTLFKGKVLVVNFWATWCGPCVAEFPHFQKLYEKYKNHPKVAFLALSTDRVDTRSEVKPFIEKNKYTFPVAYAANTDENYEIQAIPAMFIIDAEGNMQYKEVGFNPNQDYVARMSSFIESLLK